MRDPACGASTPRRRFSAHTKIGIAVETAMLVSPKMRRVNVPAVMDQITLSAVRPISMSGLMKSAGWVVCLSKGAQMGSLFATEQSNAVMSSRRVYQQLDARVCAACSCGNAQKMSESNDILQAYKPRCVLALLHQPYISTHRKFS